MDIFERTHLRDMHVSRAGDDAKAVIYCSSASSTLVSAFNKEVSDNVDLLVRLKGFTLPLLLTVHRVFDGIFQDVL